MCKKIIQYIRLKQTKQTGKTTREYLSISLGLTPKRLFKFFGGTAVNRWRLVVKCPGILPMDADDRPPGWWWPTPSMEPEVWATGVIFDPTISSRTSYWKTMTKNISYYNQLLCKKQNLHFQMWHLLFKKKTNKQTKWQFKISFSEIFKFNETHKFNLQYLN